MSRDVDDDHGAGAAAGKGGGGGGAAGADSHENDLVMPGFRFHPTEEELIEFYLRRKVEGRRFNVELITFLDLYRFDPWELPAMAVIGEKEWFFYVPRDRKYRNGDRPNRVTASGYWKATGADRMIRGENGRSIGLKKTLVFYSGKAPKGVRSSWIMNEYRLPPPPTDADLFYKSEISLCRVYKRSGIDDGHGQPSSSNAAQASSSAARPVVSRSGGRQGTSSEAQQPAGGGFGPLHQSGECLTASSAPANIDVQATACAAPQLQPQSQPQPLAMPPAPSPCSYASATSSPSSSVAAVAPAECAVVLASTYSLLNMGGAPMGSELSTLVGHTPAYENHHPAAGGSHLLPLPPPPSQPMPQIMTPPLGLLPMLPPATVSDKLWDWNPVPDTSTADYNSSGFK